MSEWRESESARRDRLEYDISMIKGQLTALEAGQLYNIGLGSGEVNIIMTGQDTPPEVISGLKKMLEARLAAAEKELG